MPTRAPAPPDAVRRRLHLAARSPGPTVAKRRRPTVAWVGALVAIAIAGLAGRLAFARAVAGDLAVGGDAQLYRLMARYLAAGRGYIRPFATPGATADVPTAEFPPLFPALLSLLHRAGLTTLAEQRASLAVLGAVTVLLVGLLGRTVAGPAVGLTAAALAAVHPMLFQLETALAAEALYAPLVTLVLLVAAHLARRPERGLRWWALLGAAVGLAALTRAEALALAPLLAVPLVGVRRYPAREWLPRLATVAAGVALVVAPWTVRNLVVLDELVPLSSNTGTLLAGANCDTTYAGPRLGLWDLECVRALPWGSLTETERARRDMRAGLSYALDHRGEWQLVAAVRVARTWGLYDQQGQANFEILEGRHAGTHRLATRGAVVLLPLAAAGVILVGVRRRLGRVLLAPVVLVTLTSLLGYGNQRFRVAAEPVLVVAACVALVHAARIVLARARTLRSS